MDSVQDFKKILTSLVPANYVAAIAGVRPFRKGGPRIQNQVRNQKYITHHYGHGGAGISICPATAKQAVSLMVRNGALYNRDNIAVLGSGVVGLFSALQAAKIGYKVTIYADRMPQTYSIDSQKMCTSQVAPGYWLPFNYQFNDEEKHEDRSLQSFKEYLKLQKVMNCVQTMNVYEAEDESFNLNNISRFLRGHSQKQNLKLGELNQTVMKFPSIQINMQSFLPELIKLCSSYGVQFCQKKLQSYQSVQNLKQKYIINCLGSGSRQIFNDHDMFGAKGYLLRYNNNSGINWGIYGIAFKEQRIRIFVLPDKIYFGILDKQNVQDKSIDQQKVQYRLNLCNQLRAKSGLNPQPKL